MEDFLDRLSLTKTFLSGGYGSAVDQNGTSLTVDAELNLDLVGVPGSTDPTFYTQCCCCQNGYLFLELQTPI